MKKVLRFLLIVSILSCLLLSVSASNATAYVVDNAQLLTPVQEDALNEKINGIIAEYQIDIRILTVDSIGTTESQTYADHYFDDQNIGLGENHDGILLLISIEQRDWAVTTNGEAHRLISYQNIGTIMDSVSPDLSAGAYYDAFNNYLDAVEKQFQYGTTGLSIPVRLLIALGSGLLLGGIVLAILRSNMRTAKAQRDADSYISDRSYDLFRCSDIFLYSHTTKIRKQQDGSSSGGGSRGGRSGKF